MRNTRYNKRPQRLTAAANARVLAILLAMSAAGATAADFTVQIGAFGISPNKAFTRDAAEFGEVLVNQGGDGVTRVSVGRYATRSEARAALTRLQIAGYNDAYVTNLQSGLTASSTPAVNRQSARPAAATTQRSAPAATPSVSPTSTAGRSSPDSDNSQAGRFRLRTHDTQSGQTTDVQLAPAGAAAPAAVIAGRGANDIPVHLRDKLVYLDGVPHIKEGDTFIPLNDAIDGKP